MKYPFDFSIVTPSLNMLDYLKRCCASVADQDDAICEHLIADGGSTDGTVEWISQNRNVKGIINKDNGMYDALNKGVKLSQGRIFAYLNCDEQYLPGTLSAVKKQFDEHPDVDAIYGDTLIVDPEGSAISYRKAYEPRLPYIWSSHLYLFSCSLFIRRSALGSETPFDGKLKDVGDMKLVIQLLKDRKKFMHCRSYLATFTMTGENMHANANAASEKRQLLMEAPFWVRALWLPLNIARLTEKFLSAAYYQKFPLEYEVYGQDFHQKRLKVRAENASSRWISK